jgi:predicted glycosyltransferase
MTRILVYSHDTYGLGNIRRMLAIVEHLVATIPDASVLILSGSPMMQAFRLSPRIDYIKLPCLSRSEDGTYAAKFLDLEYKQLLGLRADVILNTILGFEPDLMLVDKKPLGVQNELAPALEVLRRRAKRPKLVLLLREILDEPQTTISVWEKNGYHNTIQDLYDLVLIVGSADVFDTAAEYEFPVASKRLVRYCGYISKADECRPVATVREQLGIGNQSLVLVTAGGGRDGHYMMDMALQSFARPDRPANCHLLLCLGPEMQSKEMRRLRTTAESAPDTSVLEFTNDMMSYLRAADLVISMAGYNSVTELMTLGKTAVLVPRTVPVGEQWMRATRLEKLGFFSVIHPDQLTPARLMSQVIKSLGEGNGANSVGMSVDMNALSNIGRFVSELLDEGSDSGWNQLLIHPTHSPGLTEVESITNRRAKRALTNH